MERRLPLTTVTSHKQKKSYNQFRDNCSRVGFDFISNMESFVPDNPMLTDSTLGAASRRSLTTSDGGQNTGEEHLIENES